MRHARWEKVYAAAARWVDVALKGDDSLFTPGASIWSIDVIKDLYQRYNLRPDPRSGVGFDAKLEQQLGGAPDGTIQLMAEVVFVSLLVVDDIGASAKRASVRRILSRMAQPVTIPDDLDRVFDHGIVVAGFAWKRWQYAQFAYVVAFVRHWKSLRPDERRVALGDPWTFKTVSGSVSVESANAQREALLHLVFPDTFEDIISNDHKTRIRDAFTRRLIRGPSVDVDRDLLGIREALSEEYGQAFEFYDPEVSPIWDPVATNKEPWDNFVAWAKRIHDWPGFDAVEYDYKLEASQHVSGALEAAASGSPEWIDLVDDAFRSCNLVRWQAYQPLVQYWRQRPAEGLAALQPLRRSDASLDSRLGDFIDRLPEKLLSPPDLLRALSFFLLGVDPHQYPPITIRSLRRACRLTGYPMPPAATDEIRRYRYALGFLDRLSQEARERGLELRDRLDAQSVMWSAVENEPPPIFSSEEKTAFLAWRAGEQPPDPLNPAEGPDRLPPQPPTLKDLADDLFVPLEFLERTLALLRERSQLIFYGPPGTGKTYIARKLMEFIAPEPTTRAVVQFHPSYSYEDFVQGYRPTTEMGGLSYKLEDGPFLGLARAATKSEDEHVLLIDEINRGNLPRILGELLYALEDRGEPIRLMYSPRSAWALPENLLVLGTMNTADRSIGLIDAALRRRFRFVPLFPGEGPLRGLLGRWLETHVPEMAYVAEIVDRLNAELRRRVGRHMQVGHSYFMRNDLSEDVLRRIWDADILPLLEDQFFGRDEEMPHFQLDRLRGRRDADTEIEGMDSGIIRADDD